MFENNRKLGSGMESLEQRALMTANIGFSNGVVTITGDDRYGDTAEVRFEGDRVDVSVDNSEDDRDRSFRISDVREIKFNALGGSDKLFVTKDAPVADARLQHIKITYNAGAGDDHLDNLTGVTTVAYGGADLDTLKGGYGVDHLFGGSERDLIDGRSGNDFLYGEAGNDDIVGGDGADKIRGGNDTDKIWGDLYGQVTPDDDADVIMGGGGTDYIWGGGGNDSINGDYYTGGLDARDELYGQDGADTLSGEGGNDHMEGGNGDDLFYGGDDDDTLIGGWGADRLEGGYGSDTIYGDFKNMPSVGDSNDWLMGGFGLDYLYGGGGNDFLQGGQRHGDASGNPIVDGDYDNAIDRMYGEDGDDTYEKERFRSGGAFDPNYNREWVIDRVGKNHLVNWY